MRCACEQEKDVCSVIDLKPLSGHCVIRWRTGGVFVSYYFSSILAAFSGPGTIKSGFYWTLELRNLVDMYLH